MAVKTYKPGATFSGRIERTTDESEPAWPEPRRAKPNAPNVVFIVLDDTGYGHLSCYGGLCETPNLDRLAKQGLLYNSMHTTALCSPTRSCIVTGRNHHANAMAGITEVSTGYPGYNGNIPFENGFLSEILVANGYSTFAVGKWHLTPAEQASAAGPYDRWPLGRGFERYYGFLGGDTHQYYPDLVFDNHQVEAPATPDEGYHLTEDLADHAMGFIADSKQVAPDKPFFLYFCPGATHAPHQVPREWVDRYAGRFDMGWERAREIVFERQKRLGIVPEHTTLSGHDPDVPHWESLPPKERKLYARMMEVFAGFLSHTDHHIGRVVDFLEEMGELDNTIIMVISDNGASPEGGPTGSVNENRFFNFVPESVDDNLAALNDLGGPKYFNHYAWGWTWAGNTPFRRWKRETFRGGVSDPFIVHWPAGIKAKGEIRHQYAHAIDMVPTVLDALDIEAPSEIRGVTQSPMQGVSFASSFSSAEAPSLRRTQYFEMIGHRSIYHDGWRAVCPWPGNSFSEGRPFGTPISADELRRLDDTGWELYHVAEDPAETRDVAKSHPDRLRELVTLWYVEAGKFGVLPIDGRGQQRFAEERPEVGSEREQYVYFPGTQAVPENAAVHVLNRSHSLTAEVEIPDDGAEGVLLCHGGNTGGYAFFLRGGRPCYAYNYVGAQQFLIEAPDAVPPGSHRVRMEFERTGDPSPREGRGASGRVQLYIDGELVAQGELPVTIPLLIGLGGGLRCGQANASPITDAFRPPFAFTGKLKRVVAEVGRGKLIVDDEATMRAVMARQ